MTIIRTLPQFDIWLSSIKDNMTRIRLARRLVRAQQGQFGDVKPVGDGVFEMREHFGPGWRMYYVQHGDVVIVMLGGGDKATQAADIAKAKRLADTLED
ncbi:type II toxin-antitoxin system RelE/ParE family toxin [Methylomonas paludis]|uniref:Type II toxin-antitoxin system RelE/ParE family toxin n=1 Tax=Methylomonas paludis TaxID=1173101 RepID=A0A975MQU9_9GAMM|nr:type II toxin-antitoxin system RelE/ParE family toxin [Methylomonas paludis]QWF72358.1 type II toxin-antitoxin system RelE/ParE family toxin [Methylomonas paludis]